MLEDQRLHRHTRSLQRLAFAAGVLGVLIMIGAIVLAIAVQADSDDRRVPGALLLALMCVAMCSLSISGAQAVQQRHNRKAAAADERDYFVYLRSFRGKELQSVTRSGGSVNPSPDAFIIDDVLEEVVEAVADLGIIFVIGSKNADSASISSSAIVLRAGRRNWRRLFDRLSRGARCIIVIPGETPSLVEEMVALAKLELVGKVIMIMPPATGRDQRRVRWHSAASSLHTIGFRIPDYVESGLVYLVGPDLAPDRTLPYVVDGVRDLSGAFATLVASLPRGEPVCRVIGDVEAIERGAA